MVIVAIFSISLKFTEVSDISNMEDFERFKIKIY